jgi:alkylation response protein AidB-like acyl-CoA dehydrogenase
MDTATFAAQVRDWIREHEEDLRPFRRSAPNASEQLKSLRKLQRVLYDAGWLRYGWTPAVGGLGGSMLLRGILLEEMLEAKVPPPLSFAVMEVYAPAVVEGAAPEVAAEFIPRLLDGSDIWCQGFSEPNAGSDLGSLRTRAVLDGDHWIVNGQKTWTSFGQDADRCLLLVRTGKQEEAHRGITALFVDMDTPGITARGVKAATGDEEFAELFFDDVPVPVERVVGEVGRGWEITLSVLTRERGAFAWVRQAWLHSRLEELVGSLRDRPDAAGRVGEAYGLLYVLRSRSRRSFQELAAGRTLGPESSVDKVLMATAEQALFDLVRDFRPEEMLFDDTPQAEAWRSDWWYSRAASIYGGTSEIQRDIIAQRVLGLPRGG